MSHSPQSTKAAAAGGQITLLSAYKLVLVFTSDYIIRLIMII